RPLAQVSLPSPEVLPACELDRRSPQPDLDALALDAAADHREAQGVSRRRQQLVILAEAEVLEGRAGRQRDLLQLELEPAAGACRQVVRVHRETVRDVGQGVRGGGQTATLLE